MQTIMSLFLMAGCIVALVLIMRYAKADKADDQENQEEVDKEKEDDNTNN